MTDTSLCTLVGTFGPRLYCQACGKEHVSPPNAAATACSCGSTTFANTPPVRP